MSLIDFGEWTTDELTTVSEALKPWETIEEFVLKAALERYERRENRNVFQFKKKAEVPRG